MCIVVSPFGEGMQNQYASCEFVHSRVRRHYATVVDLRWCRAIHSCDSCTFLQQLSTKYPSHTTAPPTGAKLCSAVHYGICSAIKLTPKPAPPDTPNGPSVNKISVGQTPDDSSSKPRQQVAKDGEVVAKNDVLRRGEPDGESNAFLRQKTAQLQERRQREQQQKEPSHEVSVRGDNQENIQHAKSHPALPEDSHLEAKGIKKKDGLLATALSSLKQQQLDNSQTPSVKVRVSPQPQPNESPQSQQPKSALPQQQQPAKSSQPKGTVPPSQPTGKTLKKQDGPPPGPGTRRDASIPLFYFPMGRPVAGHELEATAQRIKEAFAKLDGGKLRKNDTGTVTKACGFPFYWKCPLFRYAGGEKNGHVSLQSFLAAWKKLVSGCHDDASRFMRIMQPPGVNYLLEDDFLPLIQDVVDTHPGLSFLQDAPEFHSRYVQTVISRIFYSVNRSWSGRVILSEIKRSNFLQTLQLLQEEDDINQITDFFSYEHFYVVYCKFWELDKDHDLYICREDLARHNDHAISMRMVDRIFSGTVVKNLTEDKMSYKDFVWFLMSEEDKRHPTSQEYWFRCMDLDGDGIISMYEMEYFYEEQVQKMESLGIETLPFEDCLCQMLDMIKPSRDGCITLMDLKNCKLTPIFFDTFFNLEKYLEHEQKDPFSNLRDHDGDESEPTDWERYAAEEYEILVAEEGANEEINYEDDFEPDDDQLSPTDGSTEIMQLSEPPERKGLGLTSLSDDIFKSQDNLGY